jgi:hypothetical protein
MPDITPAIVIITINIAIPPIAAQVQHMQDLALEDVSAEIRRVRMVDAGVTL